MTVIMSFTVQYFPDNKNLILTERMKLKVNEDILEGVAAWAPRYQNQPFLMIEDVKEYVVRKFVASTIGRRYTIHPFEFLIKEAENGGSIKFLILEDGTLLIVLSISTEESLSKLKSDFCLAWEEYCQAWHIFDAEQNDQE